MSGGDHPRANGFTPRANGFTLVELLVSLAIMGMTAGLLFSGIVAGRNVWQRAQTHVEDDEHVAAAQGVIRRRIEQSVAEIKFDGSAPYIDARGDGKTFSFSAPPPDARAPDAMDRYRLALTAEGELALYSVSALTARLDPAGPSVDGWEVQPLIGGVQSLDIAYFGLAKPDNQRRWRSFWQDRPQLPELVRIRVAFLPGDARRWPDLIVRPISTTNVDCRIDPETGRCRAA